MTLKRTLFLVGLIFIGVVSFSCTLGAGMGEALDLEAPVISIISPETLSNVHKTFTITGTCSDNVGVTGIEIRDKESNNLLANGVIVGNTWQAELNLEEGECTLVCTAKDAAGRNSTKSVKTLVYLVDETAPEGLSWYVDRGNNVQTGLKEKEVLEEMDYDDFRNIDIPQNESLKIYGRFYDAMSIETITLELFENDQKIIQKTITAETIAAGSSIYSPCWEFSASDFPTLESGKHFLKLRYFSRDEHGNAATRDLPYMIWWPESDKPSIGLSKVENNTITVKIGSAIPIHFFDDDSLNEVKYALLENLPESISQAAENEGKTIEEYIAGNPACINWVKDVEHPEVLGGVIQQDISSLSIKRDLPVQINVPNQVCQIKLVTWCKDDHGEVNAKVVDVVVSDSNQPILFIESPAENAIPTIKDGTSSKFDLTGYALDTTGSKEIIVAYVPDKTGTAADARGKSLINGDDTCKNGEFIKRINLAPGVDEDGWKKQIFSMEFDLFDFKNDLISYAREDKFLEICLIDIDDNKVWKQMVIAGDKTAPTIEVKSPDKDMYVYDYINGEEALEIEFKATKVSHLGVDADKYKVTVVWNDENKDVYEKESGLSIVNGYARVEIPKTEIAGKKDLNLQPKIEFEAYDVLGNKVVDRRNIVLSPLPQLKSIISGNMNGTYKKGDKINFQAVFTDAVKVDGTPKLKLMFSADDSNPKYADYNGTGNRTDTLVFTYEVQEDDLSDGIRIKADDAIIFADGEGITEIAIKTAGAGEGNAHLDTLTQANTLKGKSFQLDGKLPTIDNITVIPETIGKNPDEKYYLKENDIINATVKFSEKVNINGSPVLKLYGGAEGTSPISFTLQSISNDVITFTYKVSSSTPEGLIKYDLEKAFEIDSESGYVETITDTAGNPLKLSEQESGDKGIIIDRTKPNAPVINITGGADKKYNAAQILTLAGENGATIEYSHNGGVSWWIYDGSVSLTATGFTGKKSDGTTENVVVSGGEYTLKTRQIDKARNVSDESSGVHFTINNTFPSITGLVISKADGNYGTGEKVNFVVTYADKIRVPDAESIVLAFKLGTQNRTVNVKPVISADGNEKVEFEYTVSSEDEGKGIIIQSLTYNSTDGKKTVDLYGNSPASNTVLVAADSNTKRNNIVLDGKAPAISTYSPSLDEVATNGNVITLTFSENVAKESGLITLRRKSTATEPWRIPPVLTEDEFNSVYNELDDTDKAKLIRMDGGAPELFVKNGQPIGPYKRITHGLVGGDGSSTVPDTSTKFVLDFNIGIKDGFGYLADGTKVQVSDLRKVFEKAGYHKQEVEVTDASVVVTDNVVTITFPKTLVDGREWELFIAPGAFRDETGNLFGGLGYTGSDMNANSTHSFWSDKVAKPWIRVDRYSHGYAAIEPTVTGTGTTAVYDSVQIIASYGTKADSPMYANAASTKPTGYARVRIDCETPGATINYGWDGTVTRTGNPAARKSTLWESSTTLTDLDPKTITANTIYNGYFVVGDGELYTGRRDFVKAQGTKSDFSDSDFGYEGVFKTVVTAYANNNADYMKIEGGSSAGGMPSYGGFPLRDAEEGKGHDKGCYKVANQQFVWQSYDIISTWWILPYNQNYTKKYYWAGYGWTTHVYQPEFWSGSDDGKDIPSDYNVTVERFK